MSSTNYKFKNWNKKQQLEHLFINVHNKHIHYPTFVIFIHTIFLRFKAMLIDNNDLQTKMKVKYDHKNLIKETKIEEKTKKEIPLKF